MSTTPRLNPPQLEHNIKINNIHKVAAPHPALGGAFERAARLLLPQGLRDSAYDTVGA